MHGEGAGRALLVLPFVVVVVGLILLDVYIVTHFQYAEKRVLGLG